MVSPGEAAFYDSSAVKAEMSRVFEVCTGCRRCFRLCPSFDHLFRRLDSDDVDGDPERLPERDYREVVDLCYQCKLCFNHCPYTPPHRFNVDYPRLMLRAKASRARERGVTLQNRLLGNVHLVGDLGARTAPLANLGNRMAPVRLALERTVGVDRRRTLPRFARRSFASWFSRRGSPAGDRRTGRVALFYTCYVNYYMPEVGRAAVAVLERNGLEVVVPPQRCCSMPLLDGGDVGRAQRWAGGNVESLSGTLSDDTPLLALGPTCSYVLKHDYPFLLGEEGRGLAGATLDMGEYLMRLYEEGKLSTGFSGRPGEIAYHLPCHLKSQNIGFRSRDLLRLIPGTSVRMIDRCSGMDGTWGMKRQYFDLSMKVAGRLFEEVNDSEAALVATDCPLAGMQIQQGTGRRPLHPVQVLAMAYGLGPGGEKWG